MPPLLHPAYIPITAIILQFQRFSLFSTTRCAPPHLLIPYDQLARYRRLSSSITARYAPRAHFALTMLSPKRHHAVASAPIVRHSRAVLRVFAHPKIHHRLPPVLTYSTFMDRRTAACFACYRPLRWLAACRTLWYYVVSVMYSFTFGLFSPSAPPQVQVLDFIAGSPFAPCYARAAGAYRTASIHTHVPFTRS